MSELAVFMSGTFELVWDLLSVPLLFGFSAKQFIVFGVVASLSVGIVRLLFGIGEGAGRLGAKFSRSHEKSRGG